jgi:hypothetical protein
MRFIDYLGKKKKRAGESLSSLGATARSYASGVVKKTNDYFAPAPTVRTRDFVREVGSTVGDMFSGTKNVAVKAPKIFVEGLAYATSKNVRDQYKAGNTDILPTISSTTPRKMLADTAKAALEIAPVGKIKTTAKLLMAPSLGKRVAGGSALGYAYDVADKMSKDDRIGKETFTPGMGTVAGGVMSGVLKPTAQLAKQGIDDVVRGAKKTKQIIELVPEATRNSIANRRGPARTDVIPKRKVYTDVTPANLKPATTVLKPTELPGQTIDRYRTPTLSDLGRQVRNALPTPGMSIKDVSRKKSDAIIAAKNEKARQIVQNQRQLQRSGAQVAEPGFVPPASVKAPQNAKIELIPKEQPSQVTPPKLPDVPKVNTPTAGSALDKFSRELDEIPAPWQEGKAPVAKPRLSESGKREIIAEATGKKKETPVFGPYNKYQEEAFKERGRDIKRLSELLSPNKELQRSGYRKSELEKMPREVAKVKSELIKLGYPKQIIESIPGDKAIELSQKGIEYGKIPEHILEKYVNEGSKTPTRYSTQKEMEDAADSAVYMFEDSRNAVQRFLKNLPDTVRETFDGWISARDVARTSAYERASKFKDLPKETAAEIIKYMEKPSETAPKEVSYIARMLSDEFDGLHKLADSMGMDIGYIQDYITHIWKNPQEEIDAAYRNFRSVGGKFKFSKGRAIPTYEEGIALGLNPKYDNPAQILYEYAKKFEDTKANIRFLRSLKDAGLVVDASVADGKSAFFAITAPGFPRSVSETFDGTKVVGNFFAPKDLAAFINRAFADESTGYMGMALSGGAKLASFAQDLFMSGGIPKTAVNAFSIAQATKEALAGRIVSPVMSFLRSMSGTHSEDFFRNNIDSIKEMQARGVPVQSTLTLDSLGEVTFGQKAFTGANPLDLATEHGAIEKSKAIWNKVSTVWNKSMNEPTFKRFMPMLQINLYNDIKRKAIGSGKSAEEAADIATGAVRNFYGIISSGTMARRTKLAKDSTGTAFFAPRYREAMINFWGKNVAALNPVSFSDGVGIKANYWLENQMNLRFVLGALATYVGMDYLNQRTYGRHMWENPEGKEDKLLIPAGEKTLGVPFLSSIATVPRAMIREGAMLARGDVSGAFMDAGRTYASQLARPGFDILANENYYGQEITKETDTPGERFAKMGAHIAGSYSHPYMRTYIDRVAKGDTNAESAAKALELPIRFYSTDKLASDEFWDKWNETDVVRKKLGEIAKTDPEAAAQFASENREALAEYEALKPIHSLYSNMKERGDQDKFGGVLRNAGEFGTPGNGTDGAPSDTSRYLDKLNRDNAVLDFEMDTSGETMRDYGEYVLLKNPDGSVTPKNKDEFTVTINDSRMNLAKDREDTETWVKHANENYQLLTKMLSDENLNEYDRIKLTDKLETLVRSYQQFKEYGGKFKKGRKLEEKYRYPLVDKDMLAVERMIKYGPVPTGFTRTRRPLALAPFRARKVKRYKKRR